MTDEQALLVITSRVLDYPDETLMAEQKEMEEFVKGQIQSAKIKQAVMDRLQPLYDMSLLELQELYVDSFDYREQTGLYLTAHELGDSRKRGGALIQLQKLISECGFEFDKQELADYIPMLLELLAFTPNGQLEKLEQRMAYVLKRILDHLPSSHPYHRILDLLMTFVFEAPDAKEIAMLENEREEADLDEMPYPMFYQ